MSEEKRQNQRFTDTTLLYHPVEFAASPPLFDKPLSGNLMNISSGGMGILINKELPVGGAFDLKVIFPDRALLECKSKISRVSPHEGRFEVGLEFIGLPDYMVKKLEKMAVDYNACEERIEKKVPNPCEIHCGFYVVCKKPQKVQAEEEIGQKLLVKLQDVKE